MGELFPSPPPNVLSMLTAQSHLSLNGVKETPPPGLNGTGGAGAGSGSIFIDLDGANVGLKHWHPMPVTANGGRLGGQCEMGGVWEWTSSTLRRHAGFEPMTLYPAYTADFFDEKHNIVLGGSWATHPRIAGRKSLYVHRFSSDEKMAANSPVSTGTSGTTFTPG